MGKNSTQTYQVNNLRKFARIQADSLHRNKLQSIQDTQFHKYFDIWIPNLRHFNLNVKWKNCNLTHGQVSDAIDFRKLAHTAEENDAKAIFLIVPRKLNSHFIKLRTITIKQMKVSRAMRIYFICSGFDVFLDWKDRHSTKPINYNLYYYVNYIM